MSKGFSQVTESMTGVKTMMGLSPAIPGLAQNKLAVKKQRPSQLPPVDPEI